MLDYYTISSHGIVHVCLPEKGKYSFFLQKFVISKPQR